LAGIEVQSWRERSLDVSAGKETVVNFVDSKPNYINIYNYGLNQIYVSRNPGGGSNKYDFTVPPLSNRQWAWADWVSAVYLWQGGPTVANCRVTTYSSSFDPASVVQSGQNVIVAEALNIASMPAVTITSMPGVVVSSMPTVNANIVTGTVNATIQNASISTNVLNTVPTKAVRDFMSFLIPTTAIPDALNSVMLLNAPIDKNLKSLHMDLFNSRNGGPLSLRISIGPTQNTGAYQLICAPILVYNVPFHVDLSFGEGVDFQGGIWANSDVANVCQLSGGYATITDIVF